MQKIIDQIIKNKIPCYFISPHLDDAAFSCGGLITYLSGQTRVVVVTAFTRAGKDNHSLSGLAYAKKCGFKNQDMAEFFSLRRKEDRDLWKSQNIEFIHLPFVDALWRINPQPNLIQKIGSKLINEFRYIYPTHRFHVSKGKVRLQDQRNLQKLKTKLKAIIETRSIVFCPIALGNHVDHVLVREACANLIPRLQPIQPRSLLAQAGLDSFTPRLIYWEDAPYNLYHRFTGKVAGYVSQCRLRKYTFTKCQKQRKAMYPAYRTQFGKLFNGETKFQLPPERYYINNL